MLKIEKKIVDFIEKHILEFFLIIVTIIATFIRIKLFDFYSGDFFMFLNKWLDYMRYNGHLKALASYPGNYNAPYMTILAILSYFDTPNLYSIKIVSVLFDFFLAVMCGKLVHEITKEKNKYFEYLTYSIILFLPTVIFNSALWGQCDSIYTSFVILSLLLMVKKKYKLSFVALGVAFAFKLQFIFILPLYIVLYFRKKEFSILNFLTIPIVNFILCLPAILYGNPISKCMMVYFNQTTEYDNSLSENAINFYSILDGYAEHLYAFGILLTIFICGAALFYCVYNKIKFDSRKMLFLGLWFIVVVTYFLPGMHERYVFMGEIIAVLLLILYKKPIFITIWLYSIALINYSWFLFITERPSPGVLAVIYLFVIGHYTVVTFKELNGITD